MLRITLTQSRHYDHFVTHALQFASSCCEMHLASSPGVSAHRSVAFCRAFTQHTCPPSITTPREVLSGWGPSLYKQLAGVLSYCAYPPHRAKSVHSRRPLQCANQYVTFMLHRVMSRPLHRFSMSDRTRSILMARQRSRHLFHQQQRADHYKRVSNASPGPQGSGSNQSGPGQAATHIPASSLFFRPRIAALPLNPA